MTTQIKVNYLIERAQQQFGNLWAVGAILALILLTQVYGAMPSAPLSETARAGWDHPRRPNLVEYEASVQRALQLDTAGHTARVNWDHPRHPNFRVQ